MIEQWLGLMCQMLPKVIRASVVRAGTLEPLACWPDANIDAQDLDTAATLCGNRSAPVVSSGKHAATQEATMMVAFPLTIPNQANGVFCVELFAGQEQQTVILQLLQWGQNWLQWLSQVQTGSQLAFENNKDSTFVIFKQLFKCETSTEMCMTLATMLANEFDLDSVSVGFCENGQVKIVANSHHPRIDGRGDSSRLLQDCLQESIENRASYEYPLQQNDAGNAHERYAISESITWLKSFPIQANDATFASLLCERQQGQPLISGFDEKLESLLALAGPLLKIKQSAEMSIWQKAKQQWIDYLNRTRNGAFSPSTLITVSLVTLFCILWLAKGTFRITAEAQLEGKIQRVVVAPEDGHIRASNLRAGDSVSQGDILAQLDDRELKLELRRWQNKKAEYKQQYDKELMVLDQSQMQVAKAQIAQAEAHIEMYERRLARTQLLAPISGVLISGDLSQSLGRPVERGEVLFEVAPQNEFRLVLKVKENHIRHIKADMEGHLYLTAVPSSTIPFKVERVASVFDLTEGEVYYRTEAILDTRLEQLRPGMSGYGKIEVGKRSYLWILGHEVLAWIELKLWSWGW